MAGVAWPKRISEGSVGVAAGILMGSNKFPSAWDVWQSAVDGKKPSALTHNNESKISKL